MPQDELWACSARLTGFTADLDFEEVKGGGLSTFTFKPRWSKIPSGRNGFIAVEVPEYLHWYVTDLYSEAVTICLGGDAKHVPAVVQRKLRSLQLDFAQGALQ